MKRSVLGDGPVGEHAAAAAAGDAQAVGIGDAAPHQLVHAGHEVLVVVARVAVLDDVAELLAVAGAAARVGIEHHVALGRHPLELVHEEVAVGRVRAAVDVEDHRVLPARLVVGRLLDPGLDLLPVEAVVEQLLGLGQAQLREELLVGLVERARAGACACRTSPGRPGRWAWRRPWRSVTRPRWRSSPGRPGRPRSARSRRRWRGRSSSGCRARAAPPSPPRSAGRASTRWAWPGRRGARAGRR